MSIHLTGNSLKESHRKNSNETKQNENYLNPGKIDLDEISYLYCIKRNNAKKLQRIGKATPHFFKGLVLPSIG